MKHSTHILIADKIFNESIKQRYRDYKQNLLDGSIYPDRKDFNKTHHKDRENDIQRCVEKARELKLSDSPQDALFRLGIALHYIQDRWTALDSSFQMHENHEQNIDNCSLEALDFCLSIFYPAMNDKDHFIYEKLTKILENKIQDKISLFTIINYEKPYASTAFLDLNIAYRISYRVAEYVISPIIIPEHTH